MDERLQKALEQANYSITIQNQKKNLQLRFQNATTYSVNGGTFTVDQALIGFTHALIARGTTQDVVVIDARGNPILIPDLTAFLDTITTLYWDATNEFFSQMEKLRKARTTKQAVGL